MCSKANRKLTILRRMFKFLTFKKRRVLIKAYFEPQFKYCPLVWMFHGRQVSTANKYSSSAGQHEQKNKKTTGQINFLVVTIKQPIKLVL